MEIITSHLNADFDAFASMVAALKLYPQASLVFPGSQEKNLRDFIEVFQPAVVRRLRDIRTADVRKLIIVDTKQPARIGTLAEALSNNGLKIHIYDHHPLEPGDIRGEVETSAEVGATTTIFVELLKERKDLALSPLEATLLALGIYEETGSLLFPSTTERDLTAAAYLLRKGANLNIVSNYLKADLNIEELELLSELIKSSQETVVGGVRVAVTGASREAYVGDAAPLAHRIMEMEDVDAVVLLLDMGGKILLVFRSRVPELNVSDLAREFGGGGHPAAASATAREASVAIVADMVRDLLPRHVRPEKIAADIMTTPVITIQSKNTIKEAADMLTRYGVNVLPVLRDGAYAGLVSREVVEKAIFHGFRKNSCIDFATPDALTVEVNTPTREIETSMIEHNQRFTPVMQQGVLVGAITRTDLLRVLYEDYLRKRHLDHSDTTERTTPGRNLASWLKDHFPKDIYAMLEMAGRTAGEMGYAAYLVGGSVRDLLLREETLDIDLVIEGDGIHFARSLAQKLLGSLRTHEKFGTATIILGERKIDVATARTEYYTSPAALPTVEVSSIKKDLSRRDFTINTLAIKLDQKDFGQLIDFFGGQRDLREKTIRVLHNLSFVEDPTRAFRAIRFSERFGFKLSKHTENLIKSTIQMRLFEKLSGFRLYEELVLAFSETNPIRTLKRLAEFNLLQVIHPALTFSEHLEQVFLSVSETRAWYNLLYLDEKADITLLYLLTLLSELGPEEQHDALRRLSPPPRTKELILNNRLLSGETLRRLPAKDPAELYHLLAELPLETTLFTMSATNDPEKKKDISHFLVTLNKVRPALKGRDLKKIGIPQGPVYSVILGQLLDEKLRGKLPTRQDEEEFVISRFRK